MNPIGTTKPAAIAPVESSAGINPETLLMAAVQAQMAPEVIQQLLNMRSQLQAELAREAFYRDKPIMRAALIEPEKTRPVYDRYGKLRYKYAPLSAVRKSVDDAIKATGNRFSYRFDRLDQDKDSVTMECILTHVLGFEERSPFTNMIDHDAYMSPGQKIAACRTFAKRYTLMDVIGIEADEDTDDGATVKSEPKPEPQITPLTDSEIGAAKAVLEQSQDLQSAWHRIAKQVRARGDTDALAVLKTLTTQLAQARKQAEADREELNDRPQGHVSPGGASRPLVTADEANKLVKRIESMGFDWVWFLREFKIPNCVPQDVPAAKYPELMDQLWNMPAIRNGISYVSLAQCKSLAIALGKAGIDQNEFKRYHGLDSMKDIELAQYELYRDFDGILAERQAEAAEPDQQSLTDLENAEIPRLDKGE